MTRARCALRGLALSTALSACAGAAAPVRAPLPEVVWPRTGKPSARLVEVIEPSARAGAQPGFWRRVFDVVVGTSPPPEEKRAPTRPFGVAIAASGASIYVADPDGRSVVRLERASGEMRALECRGRSWGAPVAVALGPAGEVLVADAAAAVVARILGDGSCVVLAAGQLERPTGVAYTGGRIYVVDPPRHEVVVVAMNGTVLRRQRTAGREDQPFVFPSAIGVAPDGSLLVADVLNFRIVRITPDGAWVASLGGPELLRRPKGVAVGSDGRVYVTDAELDAVQVFAAGGSLEYTLGEPGSDPGQFAAPAGIAISGATIVVADSLNGRIQVYEVVGGGS